MDLGEQLHYFNFPRNPAS